MNGWLNSLGRTARDDRRRGVWERRSEPLLLVLAVAMIPLLVGPLLFDVSEAEERWMFVGDMVIWAVFAIDYAVRLWLAEQRLSFVRSHWIEALIVVIPFLRPLRLLRLVVILLRVSQLARRRAITGSLLAAVVGIVLATNIVMIAERGAGGPIDNWGTALWWALATITTVGYGDVVPITTVGRLVGGGLMVIGIGAFGVITANVAAWFVMRDRESEEDELSELRAEVLDLRAKLAETQQEEKDDAR